MLAYIQGHYYYRMDKTPLQIYWRVCMSWVVPVRVVLTLVADDDCKHHNSRQKLQIRSRLLMLNKPSRQAGLAALTQLPTEGFSLLTSRAVWPIRYHRVDTPSTHHRYIVDTSSNRYQFYGQYTQLYNDIWGMETTGRSRGTRPLSRSHAGGFVRRTPTLFKAKHVVHYSDPVPRCVSGRAIMGSVVCRNSSVFVPQQSGTLPGLKFHVCHSRAIRAACVSGSMHHST